MAPPAPRDGYAPRAARALAVLLGGAAALLPGVPARGQPLVVEVHGRSLLQLSEGPRRVGRDGRFQLAVQLVLSDGASGPAAGEPGEDEGPGRDFAEQIVRVVVTGPTGVAHERELRTGPEGKAALTVPDLEAGRYFIRAEYRGDAHRDRASGSLQVDLGKYPSAIQIEAPTQIGLADRLHLSLRLRVEDKLVGGEVRVRLGTGERRVYLRSGVGELDEVVAALPGVRKGDLLHIVVSYAGTDQNGAALATTDVLVTSQSHVTLDIAGPPEVAQGAALLVTGQVRDEDGPLAGQPVELEASDVPSSTEGAGQSNPAANAAPPAPPEIPIGRRLLGTAETDVTGAFRVQIQRLGLRSGSFFLAAQVRPRQRAVRPARSAELPLTVLPPEPVSAWYYAAPLLGSVGLGLLYLLLRWLVPRLRGWLRALASRSPDRPATPPPAETQSASAEVPLMEPGVSLSSGKRLVALTLRRTVDATVDGQVLDASFGRPVAGAEVVLQLLTAPLPPSPDRPSPQQVRRSAVSTEDGRFALTQLPPGRFTATVSAPGYLPQQFAATVPHRGELRGVSIRLEPLRVRLLLQWRRVAIRLLGDEARVLVATPRELLSLLAQTEAMAPRGTRQQMSELTELVERAYYSPRLCTPDMLTRAGGLADGILVALASSATARPAPPQSSPRAPHPLG